MNELIRIAQEAEEKCTHFTMRSAKQHIMIEYALLDAKDRAKFTLCMEATNKKQFQSRIRKLIRDEKVLAILNA